MYAPLAILDELPDWATRGNAQWFASRESLYLYAPRGQIWPTQQLPYTRLIDVNPVLPQVLNSSCEWYTRVSGGKAHGRALRALLQHYTRPYQLTCVDNRTTWVADLNDDEVHMQVLHGGSVLQASVLCYALETRLTHDVVTTPFVSRAWMELLNVSTTWLDAHAPGWHGRLLTAQGTGMPPSQWLTFLLTPSLVLPAQELPDTLLV